MCAWRSQAIFVTSTFRDMQAERDYLHAVVLPQLRERLAPWRMHVEMVDLRWGVPESETDAEQAILQVCLEEIARTRPFQLILRGGRYGWIPPGHTMSVTALEASAGLATESLDGTFIYERAPLPYETMRSEVAAIYSDLASGDEQRAALLEHEKAVFRTRFAARHRTYHLGWDAEHECVTDLDAFGAVVFDDLGAALERHASAHCNLTGEDEEAHALDRFVEQHGRHFFGRGELRLQLAHHAAIADGLPWAIAVVAESGGGKSALAANLCREYGNSSLFVLAHAAAASGRSASAVSMLRRWCAQMDETFKDPADVRELPEAFARLLHRTAAARRVVIVVDGADELYGFGGQGTLEWLPRDWPANARLILTGKPGATLDFLGGHVGVSIEPMPPLAPAEAQQIVKRMCAEAHKVMPEAAVHALMAVARDDGSRAVSNPLWLRTAVECLLSIDAADFEPLQQSGGMALDGVQQVLASTTAGFPPDVVRMCNALLARVARLSPLAAPLLRLLAIAREGWRESDLEAICARTGVPWSAIGFARLRLRMRADIVSGGTSGGWHILHEQMRDAVAGRWLTDADDVVALHGHAADHLVQLPGDDPIRCAALLHHLLHGRRRAEAALAYSGHAMPQDEDAMTAALADFILQAPKTETHRRPEKPAGHASLSDITLASAQFVSERAAWLAELPSEKCLDRDRLYTLTRRILVRLMPVIARTADVETRLAVMSGLQLPLLDMAKREQGMLTNAHAFMMANVIAYMGDLYGAKGAADAAAQCTEVADSILASVRSISDEADRARVTGMREQRAAMRRLEAGRSEEAHPHVLRAIAAQQRVIELGPDMDAAVTRSALASSHEILHVIEHDAGNHTAAAASLRRCLALRKEVVSLEPDVPEHHRHLAAVYCNLVTFAEPAEALALCGAAREELEHVLTDDPRDTDALELLGTALSKEGTAHRDLANAAAAVRCYQHAAEIRSTLAVNAPDEVQRVRDLSVTWDNLALAYLDAGNTAAAVRAGQAALQNFRALLDRSGNGARATHDFLLCCRNVVRAHFLNDDTTVANAVAEAAVAVAKAAFTARRSPPSAAALLRAALCRALTGAPGMEETIAEVRGILGDDEIRAIVGEDA
jgi:tetratricopeptide (TPR) repeat protein